ncbi:putative serine/threonine-protein phosphatase 6 regulatory ankyrin repeat subunit A-like, partial [Apostichopus japonicus]
FRGDCRLVEKLLGDGQDPNLTIHHGLTPLHSACMNGNLQCAQALIEKGAHVESVDAAGLTPLHYASINGYLQVVKWLIEDLDASPMVTSKKGRTPRVYAKKHGHNKVALFLGEIGSSINICPKLINPLSKRNNLPCCRGYVEIEKSCLCSAACLL